MLRKFVSLPHLQDIIGDLGLFKNCKAFIRSVGVSLVTILTIILTSKKSFHRFYTIVVTELHPNTCYKNGKKVQCHKPFPWGKEQENAFETLKQALSSPPVLASEAKEKSAHFTKEKKKRYHHKN